MIIIIVKLYNNNFFMCVRTCIHVYVYAYVSADVNACARVCAGYTGVTTIRGGELSGP